MVGRQTGLAGVPVEPFCLSTGVRGGEALMGSGHLFLSLASLLSESRTRQRREGLAPYPDIGLDRQKALEAVRSFHWSDGVIDERRLEESATYVGDRWDRLRLSSSGVMATSVSFRPTVGRRSSRRAAWELDWRSYSKAARVGEDLPALCTWLVDASRDDAVDTGFVHVDSIGDPYRKVIVDGSVGCSNNWSDEVPGYYWAVLLTSGHIEKLGGSKRVLREAPCYRAERLDGARPAIYCQLTENPSQITGEGMIAWREFLLPVLPPGYPEGTFHPIDPTHDIFTAEIDKRWAVRSMWLFEGQGAVPVGPALNLASKGEGAIAVPIEWELGELGMDSEEPDGIQMWLYPVRTADWVLHGDLLQGYVRAFGVHALADLLPGVDVQLDRFGSLRRDTDEAYRDVFVVRLDASNSDGLRDVVKLFASTLGEVQSWCSPLIERIRVVWG